MEKKEIQKDLKFYAKDNRLMKVNNMIASKTGCRIIITITSIFWIIVCNACINVIGNFGKIFNGILNGKGLSATEILLTFDIKSNFILYILTTIFIVIFEVKLLYDIKSSFGDFDIGQKGNQRFTTFEEIKQQYREIPLKGERFPGKGGVPVAEHEDKLYIDDTATNNMYLGITRSGKGEMFVFKLLDIYSRAEQQASFIVNDLKTELYPASKKTLEKRGYDVYLLNLNEPQHSMGFNPLKLAIDKYKEEDYEAAEDLCSTFATSIFKTEDISGDGKFWQVTARDLLSGLIYAHIEDCLDADRIVNDKLTEKFSSGRERYNSLSAEEKQTANEIRGLCLQLQEQIANEENKVNKFNLQAKYKKVYEKIKDYTFDDEELVLTKENEKKINMKSIITTFINLAIIVDNETQKSALDDYFGDRDDSDRAKLKYYSSGIAGDRTKGSIFSNMLSELTVYTYESIARLTAESTIDLKDIGFGDKPIAVFMSIPKTDRSKDSIIAAFLDQFNFVIDKTAMLTKEQKCKREVIFLLDEAGNVPKMSNLQTIVTTYLSMGVRYNFFVQDYRQFEDIYGKEKAGIIKTNCGNRIYIKSDYECSEEFSKEIGTRTITDISRHGSRFSLSKSLTENKIEQRLLDANQLKNLLEGQCAIVRTMKRTDLQGKQIVPYPIFNEEETKFTYRIKYMLDDFPTSTEYKSLIGTPTAHIQPAERIFDYKDYLKKKEIEKAEMEAKADELAIKQNQEREFYKKKNNFIYELDNGMDIIEMIINTKAFASLTKSDLFESTCKDIIDLVSDSSICDYILHKISMATILKQLKLKELNEEGFSPEIVADNIESYFMRNDESIISEFKLNSANLLNMTRLDIIGALNKVKLAGKISQGVFDSLVNQLYVPAEEEPAEQDIESMILQSSFSDGDEREDLMSFPFEDTDFFM